jgi:iron(III) transport system ATP-binding protein
MTAFTLESVTKRFAGAIAVNGVSLSIPSGAFVAQLGPSGCGKTTLLRLLAGFERPNAGRILFGDQCVASPGHHVPPEERHVAMVFQSYALWPHMSVSENVAFPLSIAGVPAAARRNSVNSVLERVGLAELEARKPDELSGGQRQRVDLARALVQDAGLILCDEPLANLDVHLRASMIETFQRLHRESGRTFVYVTHDQAEVLALATEIVMLDHGRIAQSGSPRTIYSEPATEAVASFVGRGGLVEAVLGEPGHGRAVARIAGIPVKVRASHSALAGPARILVRPENVSLGGPIPARVEGLVFRGPHYEARLAIPGATILADLSAPPSGSDHLGVAIEDAWALPQENASAI